VGISLAFQWRAQNLQSGTPFAKIPGIACASITAGSQG